MRKYLPLAPFVMAIALLSCTGGGDPVADNVVAPPDDLVGDESAAGLAAPANAAAAEAAVQAALPPGTGGMGWSLDEREKIAAFGPPGAPAAFSIQCRDADRTLVFVRHVPAPAGAKGTISFTGNGNAASLPVQAAGTSVPGDWRTVVPVGDMARGVARTFGGPGPVNISVSGTSSLVVSTAPAVRLVLDRCLKA